MMFRDECVRGEAMLSLFGGGLHLVDFMEATGLGHRGVGSDGDDVFIGREATELVGKHTEHLFG